MCVLPARGPPPPPFKPVADVKQLMGPIDAHADVIWEATGSIIDASGTVDRRPKNDEEWAAVRDSAIMLTEASNLLMMSPRAKDGDVWMKRSQEMLDQGLPRGRRRTPRTSISCSRLAATSTKRAHTAIRTTWTPSRTRISNIRVQSAIA